MVNATKNGMNEQFLALLEKAGLSVAQVAQKSNVHRATVHRIVANSHKRRPTYLVIYRLSRALNVATDDLVKIL